MQINHISVTFSATIPTQPYGNVGVNVAWSGELGADESPEAATRELFDRIRLEVAAAVKPIAEAKLRQAQSIIESLPPKEREALMQTLGVSVWINAVAPETLFAAPPEANDEES